MDFQEEMERIEIRENTRYHACFLSDREERRTNRLLENHGNKKSENRRRVYEIAKASTPAALYLLHELIKDVIKLF